LWDDDDEDEHEQMVSKCINILQVQLSHKKHYEFFLANKVEIVFALLLYCRSGSREESFMVEEAEKFVALA
jgi:hypothetical protein